MGIISRQKRTRDIYSDSICSRVSTRKENMISDIEATLIARIYNVSFEDAKDGSWIDKYEEEE
tara:strand:+ start:1770 stop:1958 length:189 start_codon:yes stop_codon:yes gene_type:complete